MNEDDLQPTLMEGRRAPEGYAFLQKRFMKKCKSCLWWKKYTDGRDTSAPRKRKSRACTKIEITPSGRPLRDPVTGVILKGKHYGERTDPLFSCEDFKPKIMPLTKIKESKDGV